MTATTQRGDKRRGDEAGIPDPTCELRAYRPGDERPIVALFERVFGRSMSEARWRWKLEQRASSVENVGLAIANGLPVCQYAGIPTRVRLPGGERQAMVVVDVMTADEFRRRGLMTSLGGRCHEKWREAGVAFALGLPNEAWGSRSRALGWEALFPLRWMIRPLRPEATLARRTGWSALGRLTLLGHLWNRVWDLPRRDGGEIRVRDLESAGAEVDELWRRCLRDDKVTIVRDSDWVNWRYLSAPELGYRVLLAERQGRAVGFSAYRIDETAGWKLGLIAEVLTAAADRKGFRALIAATVGRIRAEGAEGVATLAIPGTAEARDFRRSGFVVGRPGFTVRLAPLDTDLPLELLREPGNWTMAGADFDVI